MQPRPIDPTRDLPAVADFLGRTRAAGGLSHPGGIQWWLRSLGMDGFDDLGAWLWTTDDGALAGFALVDGTFAVIERLEGGPTTLEQVEFLDGELRAQGRPTLDLHVADGDRLLPVLEHRGFGRVGVEFELIAETVDEPKRAPLPDGYRWGSLHDVTDDAYVEGHRAAWSDTRPSSYRRELHDAMRAMPQFRPELVTIAIATDGTVASYCVGWLDARSRTLEIEPLGTHRDHRRLGLAHAVVKEVQHRAWANGARRVLVWNSPATNVAAYALYTGAGMPPARTLIQLRKEL